MSTYNASECAVFFRTREKWGQFSNMCAGFPLVVNSEQFRTSEALYQALRFPSHPDIQEEIQSQKSPMLAKMVAKANLSKTRPDWDTIRVEVMRFAVNLKFTQHWVSLKPVLYDSIGYPIVEKSRKDNFWGAKETEPGVLVGDNVLGTLVTSLMIRKMLGLPLDMSTPMGSLLFGQEF